MEPTDLERYARHIMLREIGGPGQQRLGRARIAVVGAGGLGAPALLYLAAAGVGHIRVIDDDEVALSNLQRQVLFATEEIGRPKVAVAAERLAALNPGVVVERREARLDAENAAELLAEVDLALDGTDSFAARRAVNAACVALGTPLLSGAIGQWEGQVSIFHPAANAPCYACLFPSDPAPELVPTCAEAGVVGALPGLVGSLMALEAIKHVAKAGRTLQGRLLLIDALAMEFRSIEIERRPDCAVCGRPS